MTYEDYKALKAITKRNLMDARKEDEELDYNRLATLFPFAVSTIIKVKITTRMVPSTSGYRNILYEGESMTAVVTNVQLTPSGKSASIMLRGTKVPYELYRINTNNFEII